MNNVLAWSCGGGRQSVALGVLIIQGRIPKPDIAVIVDTEREKSSTWQYYHSTLKPALAEIGVDLKRIYKSDFATVDLYRNDDLLIPAFTVKGDSVGKLPTYCSNEWKQRVVRRYLRSVGVQSCDLYLGISINEADRMKDSGLKWLRHVYPLVDLGLSVDDCVEITRQAGWPPASSSACWMCPNQNQHEWLSLSSADFAKAQEFERKARERDPFIYLTRTAVPLTREAVAGSKSATLDHCGPHCMT